MRKILDATQFLADIAAHQMTVYLDNDLYRHVTFRKPGDSNMWFEILTWPMNLAVHGDMGTWTFSRIADMFSFFRSDSLRINASYWTEKIGSESRFGGPSKRFIDEVYEANVRSSLDGYSLSDADKSEVLEALKDGVFSDDETSARRAVSEFKCYLSAGDTFEFSDPWEIDGEDYTYHYLWCLYAIVWGIQQYDAAKKPV